MRWLKSCVLVSFAFELTSWPYNPATAKRLDNLQVHCVEHLVGCSFIANESTSQYFDRRSKIAGRIVSTSGRWSQTWATRIRAWHRHVQRANDSLCWPSALYNIRGMQYLEDRRVSNLHISRSRTATRAPVSAKVFIRWHDGVPLAADIPPLPPRSSIEQILKVWGKSPWHRYVDFAANSS